MSDLLLWHCLNIVCIIQFSDFFGVPMWSVYYSYSLFLTSTVGQWIYTHYYTKFVQKAYSFIVHKTFYLFVYWPATWMISSIDYYVCSLQLKHWMWNNLRYNKALSLWPTSWNSNIQWNMWNNIWYNKALIY